MGTIALVLFGIAALGGIALGTWSISGKLPPLSIALPHGVVAAAGLIVLIIALMQGAPALASYALVGFLVAAIGGGVLFLGFHLRKQPLPLPLTAVYALVAVASFVMLMAAMMI